MEIGPSVQMADGAALLLVYLIGMAHNIGNVPRTGENDSTYIIFLPL